MHRDETIDITPKNETRAIQTGLRLYDDEVCYQPGKNLIYNKYQVEARPQGGNWTPARICRMHADGTCDVKLKNRRNLLRNVTFGTNMRNQREEEWYRSGIFVEIRDSRLPDPWTRAVLHKLRVDKRPYDRFEVFVEGFKDPLKVYKQDVRLPVGTKVEGFMGAGRWNLATVERVHIDRNGLQTFDLLFADGYRVQNVDAKSQVRLTNTDLNPCEATTRLQWYTSSDSGRNQTTVSLKEGLVVSVKRPDSSLTWEGILQSRCDKDECKYVVKPLGQLPTTTQTCNRAWITPIYCKNDMDCSRSSCYFYHSTRVRRIVQCEVCRRHVPNFFPHCVVTARLKDVAKEEERSRFLLFFVLCSAVFIFACVCHFPG